MDFNDLPELDDCPFCGGKAIIVRNPGSNWDGKEGPYINVGAGYGLWYVGCPFLFFEDTSPHCEINPSACWYAHLEDAIRHWNKRKE